MIMEKKRGKTANCIRMLQYLNDGRTHKKSELKDLLDTNERNIPVYRNELNDVSDDPNYSFFVDYIPGPNGGYKLDNRVSMPIYKMTNADKECLLDLYNFAMSKKDYVNKKGCMETMTKVFSMPIAEEITDYGHIMVDKVNSVIKETDIEKNYKIIAQAIKDKKVLKIKYRWLKKPTAIVMVEPYELFLYDNEWRFFAWDESVRDGTDPMCYFKLSRVENIEITDKTFIRDQYYDIHKYLAKNVFSQNGQMFKLTLIAHGVRAKLMKEKDYGYNQACEDLPDGSVKVTMEMQKNPSTYNTILSFGNLVEVVEPEWLMEKIRGLSFEIYKKYAK